jgi:hypothetical protein
MEAESVSTGKTGVEDECAVTGTSVWVRKEAVIGSVTETGVLCWAQADRTEMNVVIVNILEIRLRPESNTIFHPYELSGQ